MTNFYESHSNWPQVRVVETITPDPGPGPGPGPDPTPNGWSATNVYNGGDQVVVNGVTYEAKWYTQGDDPEQSGAWGPWKII